MEKIYKGLFDHVDRFWSKNIKESFTWELGKINEILPNFSVIRISPKSSDEPWVYLTQGAWEVNSNREYRSEFFIMCPYENPRHVETLAMLASFHADPKHHFGIGSSIDIGRGWLEESDCDHLLVSLPYPFGPDLEICKPDNDITVKYLWLLPITRIEDEYLKQRGLEALEQKFDKAELDFLDSCRSSVIC